ncbi:hypothetical protein [Microbacterium sp. XT11]|uniref:hypothetical protein n=1 Tax=Microbacterium sp. XT11 TaxID=367477 RepID=UPI00082C65BB|nr:hypothetical protein [Microbacterium sp. XT11]
MTEPQPLIVTHAPYYVLDGVQYLLSEEPNGRFAPRIGDVVTTTEEPDEDGDLLVNFVDPVKGESWWHINAAALAEVID